MEDLIIDDFGPINIDSSLWSLVDAVCANMPYEELLETEYVKSIRESLQRYPRHPYSVSCSCFLPWDIISSVYQSDDNDMNLFYDDDRDTVIFDSLDDTFNGLLHIAEMVIFHEEYSDILDREHILKMRKYCTFMKNVSSILDINEVSEMMDTFSMD